MELETRLRCDRIDPHIDRVTKWQTVRVECLPGAFVRSICKWGREGDLEGGLCASAGRIERDFFRRLQQRSTNLAETIVRIPVAGAAVFDRPLFVYA